MFIQTKDTKQNEISINFMKRCFIVEQIQLHTTVQLSAIPASLIKLYGDTTPFSENEIFIIFVS